MHYQLLGIICDSYIIEELHPDAEYSIYGSGSGTGAGNKSYLLTLERRVFELDTYGRADAWPLSARFFKI
jgi:hypothetical protein